MKKILVLIFVFAVAVFIVACGKSTLLDVSPWDEKTAIIKISPIDEIGDGSDSVCYFTPFQVGEDAGKFASKFNEGN